MNAGYSSVDTNQPIRLLCVDVLDIFDHSRIIQLQASSRGVGMGILHLNRVVFEMSTHRPR